jgi:hypothetical protein
MTNDNHKPSATGRGSGCCLKRFVGRLACIALISWNSLTIFRLKLLLKFFAARFYFTRMSMEIRLKFLMSLLEVKQGLLQICNLPVLLLDVFDVFVHNAFYSEWGGGLKPPNGA